jgi:putative ABC transport system permease protein
MRDDVRDALRSLRADWRFTLIAAGLLAVTLGAITAVFAIVQAIVLHPFPFHDQDRLVVIWQRDLRRALPVIEVAYGEATDWRHRSRSFEQMAVVGSVNWSLDLVGKGETQRLSMAAVSTPFFEMVGTKPAVGRGFLSGDEHGSPPRVAVISHGLWVRRFGRDPTIIGRAIAAKLAADGPIIPIEVIGVSPEVFDYPRGTDIWVPAAPLVRTFATTNGDGADEALNGLRVFFALGRLVPGVTPPRAENDLTHVIRTTDTKSGPEPPSSAVVTPIAAHLLGPARPVLWTLFGGATLMLLIVCANVAGLQVSRTTARQRALGIRAALGASNGRLVRQTFVESALITALALSGAVLVTMLSARALVLLAPEGVPRIDTVTLLDGRVLAFGVVAAFTTVLLSGVWPALVAARLDTVQALAHGGSLAADPRGRRVQRGVVIAQVAVSLTLIAGAALFARTVRALDQTALGFDPANLLALTVSPSVSDLTRWRAFYEALETRAAALPNVTAAGSVFLRPLSGPIGLDSQPIFPGQDPRNAKAWGLNPIVNLETVTPPYFRAMSIPILRGRAFTASDIETAPGTVIVGEATARRLWPGRDALGQRMRNASYRTETGRRQTGWQTVVGVAKDVRYRGLTDVRLDLYMPAAQSAERVQFLMVRARGNPADVTAAIRDAARALDSAASVSDATIMSDVVASESAPWRFMVQVFTGFAALAVTAAAIGLGAVITLAVATRRRELAIRAALGADRARLRSAVINEGLWLVACGTALGLVLAVALGRAVGALLVGVEPHDAIALGGAATLVSATGLVACWWPAQRAADTNPMDTLRAD